MEIVQNYKTPGYSSNTIFWCIPLRTPFYSLTEAIQQRKKVEITNFSNRSGAETVVTGLPVAILVSVQTGRRYVALYGDIRRRFHSFRLDCLKSVQILEPFKNAEERLREWQVCREQAWGAALSARQNTEHFSMILSIDAKKEPYILNRLEREGRGGKIERLDVNRYRYSIAVTDSGELMNWVKTFTGRILSVEGDNQAVVARFYRDMQRMATLYGEEEP